MPKKLPRLHGVAAGAVAGGRAGQWGEGRPTRSATAASRSTPAAPAPSWSPRTTFGWWIQALALGPNDAKHIVYGTGATLCSTRDLTHWAPQIRDLEEVPIRQLVSPPTGEAHLLSGFWDIGVMYHERLTASPSRGMASNPVFGTSTGLSPAAAKPSYVVRAGWSDDVDGAYSNDDGRTWAPFGVQPAVAKEVPGPIATNAHGGVLLWSFGPVNP